MGPHANLHPLDAARPTFSLRWKILTWFFVNLLVLSAAIFFFLRTQLHLDINSLVAGPTGDRLESIAGPLAAQLHGHPQAQWGELLDQAVGPWRSSEVRAGIFRDDGTYLAGDIPALPDAVQHAIELHERRHHGPLPWQPEQRVSTRPAPAPPTETFAPSMENPPAGRPGPPPGGRERGGPPSDGPGEEDDPPPGVPQDGPMNEPPSRRERRQPVVSNAGNQQPLTVGPFDKFLLRAGEPSQYWVGVHLGEMERPVSAARSPSVTLVFASTTLRGGGLLFDYYPWVWFAVGLVVVSVLIWLPFVTGVLGAIRRMLHIAQDVAQGSFKNEHVSQRRDELGGLSRALAHMTSRLEEAANGQKRFLGDTAHELLSPLCRLEVALSILEQQTSSANRERYITQALEDVRHTSTLVHDLLAFTKADLRGPDAELAPVAVAELARKAVAREAAADRVDIEIPEHLYACVDPDLVVRALANVVRNAVRYAGHAGPIRITAAPSVGPEGEANVALHVSDQGPGVAPESLDRLFDPFFRPEVARSRETGGNGLGLSIVKSCVEACGGWVQVRNLVPHGLQLTFVLPAAPGAQPADGQG